MAAKKPIKTPSPKISKAKRLDTLGPGDRNVHLQMALAMFIATIRVGLADGKIDKKEMEAGLRVTLGLAAKSKSEYVADAAKLLATGTTFVNSMREVDERGDDEILRDLSKRLKTLPEEDQYRFHMAFIILCVGVGRASGGGLLKGPAFSSEEDAATNEMVAVLWGVPKPIKSPLPAKFLAFAREAEGFCELYGI
jgi:hypothetical protein